MIKSKKLAFSAVTVRQLTQNMTDEQLRGVAGGTGGIQVQTNGPQLQTGGLQQVTSSPVAGGVTTGGGPRPLTTQCPSVNQTVGQC